MSTIIKATDRNRGIHGVAFNFEDMGRGADAYLAQVREQAKQILAQAMQEDKLIRQRAEVEGRAAGQRAAEETLARQVAQQMETVFPALDKAIASIEQERPAWLSYWEQRAVHLAAAIAARVIRRELQSDPQIPLNLVREALELAPGRSDLRVLLNPADHAALGKEVERIAAMFSRLGSAAVVADPAITPGGCRIETRHGAIDQQFEAQLARIEAELT